MTTTQEILTRYELQVDDASELSSTEELALANEVYNEICNERDWEWLKSTFTGNTSTTVDYIALPSNFRQITPNKNNESVVFVGSDYSEYKVIPFSSRRDYRDADGYCYIDVPNSRLVFTLQPTEVKAVEYDYMTNPTDLTTSLVTPSVPLFNSKFWNVISYGMASKFNNIELSEKASSYQKENQLEYYRILEDMRLEDANIKLSL